MAAQNNYGRGSTSGKTSLAGREGLPPLGADPTKLAAVSAAPSSVAANNMAR